MLIVIIISLLLPVKKDLQEVTVNQFAQFVEKTDYVTDAEKYNWSFVQKDIKRFGIVEGANWNCPDGQNEVVGTKQVTQISYNDAVAYCKYYNVRLPTYKEYFDITEKDPTHLRGVWEITSTENEKEDIRLAGGSYLCNQYCEGWKKGRELFVDKETGNIHIGFSVIK